MSQLPTSETLLYYLIPTLVEVEMLRTCRVCGLEAVNKNDLELFTPNSSCKYNRANICIKCTNELSVGRYRFSELVGFNSFLKMAEKPLRKCVYCGIEAWSENDLELFVRGKRGINTHGRANECKKCHSSFYTKGNIYYNKERQMEQDKNRIVFKYKNIRLLNPRTNICSQCGKKYPEELKRQTCVHHIKYDENNPIAYTIELCNSCHMKLHSLLRKHGKA